MLYRFVLRARFIVQVVVLRLSYAVHRDQREKVDWAVGPYEVATMVHQLSSALPSAHSILLARHPFFSFRYDWTPSTRRYPGAARLRYWLLGPWKLGEIARRYRGVIYVSADGYVNAEYDRRMFEFAFLKRAGVRVVCYFTGNDIRSPKRMAELERQTGRPNIATYLRDVNAVFATDGYDEVKRRVAASADRHADLVFNADLDQRSYLNRPSEPFRYFYPDGDITDDLSRYDDRRRVIVHAPSSPIIKGTQLVRASIDRLRADGYDFEYVELVGVPHEAVAQALRRAHIVLNEFYSYVPGVFGVEAMAAGAALITSADETLDPQLPAGSNKAWVPTRHFELTEHVKELLDDPVLLRDQAAAGVQWVRQNAAASVSGRRFDERLRDVLEGRL